MSLAQSFINPTGEIILHRRKIKPTYFERSLRGRRYISEIFLLGTEIGSRDMFREHTAFFHFKDWSCNSMTYVVEAMLTPRCAWMVRLIP